jgi:hypothetical protein
LATVALGREAGVALAAVGAERLARAVQHRHRARRLEIEALTHELHAGALGPPEPWPVGGPPLRVLQ